MEMDRQTDTDMNKKRDGRRDGAARLVKATGAAALLVAPVARRAKTRLGGGRREPRRERGEPGVID